MARPAKISWRPMGTAPKDKPILLLEEDAYIEGHVGPFGDQRHVGIGKWDDKWFITWDEGGLEWAEADPTMWADITLPEVTDGT